MSTSRRRRPHGARRAPPGQAWVEFRVITSPAAAEAVAAMLWDLAVSGVAEDRPVPGLVRLRCYKLPSPVDAVTLRALRARVRGLSQWGLDPGPASVTRRTVASRPWARAWRMTARPIRVGRLVVAPTRSPVPRRSRALVVRIDPGMAFGSGVHASTRLCLRALARCLRTARDAAVLDIGTGSGILAIAAARLGAKRVRARDIDPVAVAVARRNVRTNGVGRIVHVARGAGVGPRHLRYDVIVANIVAETIVALLPTVRAGLAPGGVLIGSGIVEDRLDEVLRAGARAGLRRAGVLASGEWRAVILASPGTFSPPPRLRLGTEVERWPLKTN